MSKQAIKTTPSCIKCKESTVHVRTSENSFLNTLFKTEWFECKECGKTQAKIVKIIGKNHGPKI